MGGGEGAKERRRLKRLQATQGGVVQTSDGRSGQKRSIKKGKDEKPLHKRDPSKATKSSKSSHAQSIKAKSRTPAADSNKKKTKVKKPKHLKRKLEQASAQVDDETKEKLELELEEWEQKKKQYSENQNNSKSTNKRQKVEHSPMHQPVAQNSTSQVQPSQSAKPERSTKQKAMHKTTLEHKSSIDIQIKPNGDDTSSTSTSSDDDLDDSSDGESLKHDERRNTHSGKKQSSSREKEDADPDSDSDGDDDSDDEAPNARRQRGKRRRGRKDTSKKIEETKTTESEQAVASKSQKPLDEAIPSSQSLDNDDAMEPLKQRYCIGRKPVTDFVLGQSYTGTVVYVKPFGVFFDIGCHSDAFCHVSRLSDAYVESPDTAFHEGDSVPNIRVVEIDRKRKRITVSLQTEARLEDERASFEAREERKKLRESKSGKKKSKFKDPIVPETTKEPNPQESLTKRKEKQEVAPLPKDPSTMTPAELKRARKLARRAVRREQATEGV